MFDVITQRSSQTSAFLANQSNGVFRHAPSRLINVGEEAAAILAGLHLLPPQSIGIENARHLIGTCLQWYNNRRPKQISDHSVDKSSAAVVIEYAKLDILVTDDGPSLHTGRLCVTAVSKSETGPFIAFMLGFAPPTWETLASALASSGSSPGTVACLHAVAGGAA